MNDFWKRLREISKEYAPQYRKYPLSGDMKNLLTLIGQQELTYVALNGKQKAAFQGLKRRAMIYVDAADIIRTENEDTP